MHCDKPQNNKASIKTLHIQYLGQAPERKHPSLAGELNTLPGSFGVIKFFHTKLK
jgi:hypothetical protein